MLTSGDPSGHGDAETIRDAVYFTHHQHLEPILVEAAWITGALVMLTVPAIVPRQHSGRS